MKTFLRRERKRITGAAALGTVTGLLLGAVLLWYGADGGSGAPALTALEPARGRTADPPVDLNGATAEELDDLPGIGPVLAERIVDFREENGPFACPEEILAVLGIGPAVYEELAPYIGAEQESEKP